LSNDVMEKLSLTLNAGYHLEANQWFGSASANYRLEAGPYLNATLARGISSDLSSGFAGSMSISQPVIKQYGAFTQIISGETGLKQDLTTDPSAFVQLDYQIAKDRAFQSITTPLGFHQGIEVNVNAANQLQALAVSDLAVQGLSNRQALLVSQQWQWLDSGDGLMDASPILPALNAEGFSARTSADYRINLGPLGRSFTSALYWRNTEVSLNGEVQYNNEQWQSATGFTVQPSFNVLRNSNLVVNPALSLYYLPNTNDWTVKFGLRVADF